MEQITYDALQNRVTQLGAPDVIHSDFETVSRDHEEWTVKIAPLGDRLMAGSVRFVRTCEGWEDDQIVQNPTFADVLRAMQRSIEATGDRHHVYFEGTSVRETREPQQCDHCGRGPEAEEGPVTVVDIITGS